MLTMWTHRKMRSRMKGWPPGRGHHHHYHYNTDMPERGIKEAMGSSRTVSHTELGQWVLILTAVLVLCPALVSAQCPTTQCHCEVQEGQPIINCRYRQLSQVPTWQNSGSNFYELTLANNMISSLGPDAFSGLRIKRLDLSANVITSIDPDAFNGIADTLEELLLHVKDMQAFPTQALAGLVNLKFLVIEGFNISALPQGALNTQVKIHTLKVEKCQLQTVVDTDFQALKNELIWLSLRDNQLVNVPQSAISQLAKLEILDLKHNKLVVLADNLFSGNQKIKMLDFSNNQLQTVRPNAYVGLQNSLETLILQSNKLTDNQLPPLKLLRFIKSLNLANNMLVSIPEDTFIGIQTMETLNLRSNKLASLTKAPFVPLTNSLKTLELAGNQIANIESGFFGAFSVLEVVDLDGQNLNGVLDDNTFAGLEQSLLRLSMKEAELTTTNWQSVANLAKLQSLNVAKNRIMQIPPFTFQKLTQLATLDVSYNSISEVSQRGMHGPQATLNSVNFISNGLEAIPECTFYNFQSLNNIKLSSNPLRCDCDLVWLRKWVDIKYPTNQNIVLYGWRCASPAELANRQFYNVSQAQLCPTQPTPTPKACEDLSVTTTPVPATGSSTPSIPSPGGPTVKVTNISHDSAIVRWTTWGETGNGFIVDTLNKRTNRSEMTDGLASTARQHQLKGLMASTPYTVCVTFQFDDNSQNTKQCEDFDTFGPPAPVTGGSNVGGIVGGVVGVLAFLALLILLGFLVVRSRTGGDQWFSKPAWLGGTGNSGDNAGNTTKWRTPTGVPQIGYNSKRFSRPKSREAGATASITSSQLQNNANDDLEMKLAGFSQEERDRIINMLTTTGGSTVSMISSGSSQRYVPELPPRPQHLEGYLNPQSVRDEEDDPYKHIYDEIPGANANYYETPVSQGVRPKMNNNDRRDSVHSGKYEEPYKNVQEGACYI